MTYTLKALATAILLLVPTYGDTARHTVAPRFAYVANNSDDTVSIFAIENARLRSVGYVYTGAGSNPRSIVVSPSQAFLYVAGNSGIAGYAVSNISGSLSPVPGSPFETGSVLSLAMHPSGRFLIALTGMGISSYAIDPNAGALTSIQSVSGDSPISGAIDPTGSFLFTANFSSNTISGFTINQSTGILAPVPGSPFPSGSNPQCVAIPPHGKFLYVPNGNGANVSGYAINSKTGALVQVPGSPFSAGSVPAAAAASNSFLFVGNSADKTVSQYVINATSGSLTQVAAPFSTGNSGPLGITASPTEPLIYVADHDSDELLVLGRTKAGVLFNESSVRTRGSAISIALVTGSAPVTYSPKFVYESNGTTNDIWGYQVGIATGSLGILKDSPFTSGISPQALVSDFSGRFVFTANAGDNSVSAFAINSETGALMASTGSPYSAGSQPSAVAVDNGAHYVYVSNAASDTISGYSVTANGNLISVPGSPFPASGVQPRAVAIDPQGRFLYVANAQSNTVAINEIDARTGSLQALASVSTGNFPSAITINRSGKYLYVLNQSSQSISAYGIDSVTGQLLQLPGSPFPGTGSPNSMIADPLGERIYVGDVTTITAYRFFDTKGNLRAAAAVTFRWRARSIRTEP